MTEHGVNEAFATALAACVAFLGALGAAMKFWPKAPAMRQEHGGSMEEWRRSVDKTLSDHNQQLIRAEQDRQETRETIGDIFDEIKATRSEVSETRGEVSEIKGMLNARREPR